MGDFGGGAKRMSVVAMCLVLAVAGLVLWGTMMSYMRDDDDE